MADVLEDSRDKVQENLLANGGEVSNRISSRFVVIQILTKLGIVVFGVIYNNMFKILISLFLSIVSLKHFVAFPVS